MKYMYALYEIHKYEGAHMHAVFSTRKAALKSMLVLKRREVQSRLNDRKELGKDLCGDFYMYCWEDVTLMVEKLEVHE